MFSKPLRQLVAADIERVCAEAVQEDENAEFKRTLAAKGGKPDPWIGGADAIGDHARNDIVKEIVAFANAYGGTLVLASWRPRTNRPGLLRLSRCPGAMTLPSVYG